MSAESTEQIGAGRQHQPIALQRARAFYDQRRANGDTHNRALRALANRLVGILHGCLRHQTLYDEHTAWGHRTELAA